MCGRLLDDDADASQPLSFSRCANRTAKRGTENHEDRGASDDAWICSSRRGSRAIDPGGPGPISVVLSPLRYHQLDTFLFQPRTREALRSRDRIRAGAIVLPRHLGRYYSTNQEAGQSSGPPQNGRAVQPPQKRDHAKAQKGRGPATDTNEDGREYERLGLLAESRCCEESRSGWRDLAWRDLPIPCWDGYDAKHLRGPSKITSLTWSRISGAFTEQREEPASALSRYRRCRPAEYLPR